eukprot:scaffold83818_cov35-Tisochrysis_lutea.AAC.9
MLRFMLSLREARKHHQLRTPCSSFLHVVMQHVLHGPCIGLVPHCGAGRRMQAVAQPTCAYAWRLVEVGAKAMVERCPAAVLVAETAPARRARGST